VDLGDLFENSGYKTEFVLVLDVALLLIQIINEQAAKGDE
jgi:hypothetical protein